MIFMYHLINLLKNTVPLHSYEGLSHNRKLSEELILYMLNLSSKVPFNLDYLLFEVFQSFLTSLP
jgi:hypothetical protein